jgi:hypothetical protein
MNEDKTNKVDLDWVKTQMSAARIRRGSGDAVLKLLDVWNSINLDDDLSKEAVSVFKSLALSHSLIEPYKDEIWVPAQPGQIIVTDVVRVKADAFTGELGRAHNGRRGVIVAIRSGDVIVRSTDDIVPVLDGVHYSPYSLEKRIK